MLKAKRGPRERSFVGPDLARIDELKIQVNGWVWRLVGLNGWSQKDAAFYLKTSPAALSRMRRGKLEKVSLDRLFRCVAVLKPDFRIALLSFE